MLTFVVQWLHSGTSDETMLIDNVLDVNDRSDPGVAQQYGKMIGRYCGILLISGSMLFFWSEKKKKKKK